MVAKLEVAEPAICSGMRHHWLRYGVRPWSQQIAESIDNDDTFCGCRISPAKEPRVYCRAFSLDVQRLLALRLYEPSLLTTLMLRT